MDFRGIAVLEERDTTATPLTALGLSTRPYNALRRAGIHCVETLAQLSEAEIRAIRNVGDRSTAEIVRKLAAF